MPWVCLPILTSYLSPPGFPGSSHTSFLSVSWIVFSTTAGLFPMPGATLGPRPAYLPTPSHHLGLSLKKSTPKTKLTASTMCFCCPCFSLCTSQYHLESDAQSPSSSIRSGTEFVSFTAEPLEPSTVPGTQRSTNTLRDFNKSGDDRFQLLAKST